MKFGFLLSLILMSNFDVSFAAEINAPISVAVFNFNSPYRVRLRNDLGLVTSLLTANLSSNAHFTLVDRAELKKIMKEQSLGLTGEISPETAAKIGRIVGAQILVTGEVFNVGDTVGTDVITEGSDSEILIVTKVIGTETTRVFTQRETGLRKNLVTITDELSKKIAKTISEQATNLIADNTLSREERLAQLIKSLQNKRHLAISVDIKEQSSKTIKTNDTVQTELGHILMAAGFEVVDEKSDKRPDVVITGRAGASSKGKLNSLSSSHATVSIKAQDRATGKIIALDQQDGVASDLDKSASTKTALINATDDLSERLLPLLTK